MATQTNENNLPSTIPSHVRNFIEWTKSRHLRSLGLRPDFELTQEAKNMLPKHLRANETKKFIKSHLKILYLNAQSMNKKLININNQALSVSADIIVISETWHSEHHHYVMDSFSMISEQPRLNTSNNAGGIAIFVKNTLKGHFSPISKKRTNTKYAQDAQICAITGLGLTIWGLYRSPNIQPAHDKSLLLKLKNLQLGPKDIILGDFNLPTIDWDTMTAKDRTHADYLALFQAKGFDQLINEPTHIKGSTLDLVYVGHQSSGKVSHKVDHEMKVTEKDHYPIVIKYHIGSHFEERNRYTFKTVTIKDKCDYDAYNKEIYSRSNEINACNVEGNDQDTPAIEMTKLLLSIHEKYAPSKLIKIDILGDDDGRIKKLRNKARRLRGKLTKEKENPDKHAEIRKELLKCSKRIKSASNARRKLLDRQRIQKLAKSNKDTWKVMKDVGKPKSDIASQEKYLKPDGSVTTSQLETANLLISYYTSITQNIGTEPDLNNLKPKWLDRANAKIGLPYHSPMTLEQSLITDKTLVTGINKLNSKSAPGFCGLFTNVIKLAGPGILTPLKNLFNNCIRAGVFPIVWKIAWVKSLPKRGGEAMDVANTRPISIIATIGKLFEICLGITEDNFHSQWFKDTEFQQVMPKCQYGFRTRSSCEDNLAAAIHKINHCLDNDFSVDVLCYDYRKAFDTTTFAEILRNKIETGIGEMTKVWKSYLTDRYSFVRLRDIDSEMMPTLAGCPQGCPRSPHHFATYISDLYPKDGHEILTEQIATNIPYNEISEKKQYMLISEFIDAKVNTAEDAIKFKIDAAEGNLLLEFENWSKERHAITTQNTENDTPEVVKHFIKKNCKCNRRRTKQIESIYEDMYVKTYTDIHGVTRETQSSKQKRLTRHLNPSWYADDLKSISIPSAEPRMVRLPGLAKLWPPHITYGDQQSFISETEKVNEEKQLSFHPLKCEVLYLGRNNPQNPYYMKHPKLEGEKIRVKKAEVIRDLGLWYTVSGRGYLDTYPTFEKMIIKANAMIIATKRMLRGATLEKYNLIFHSLIKSIFVFGSSIIYKYSDQQNDELHAVYKRFFSNVPITSLKTNGICVLPETIVSFIRKLNLKRVHKLLNKKTILDPEDYWEVSKDGRVSISKNKMKKGSIKCWCNTITQDYVKIHPRGDTRISDEKLDEYMNDRILDDAKGLRLRLEIANGAYEHSFADWKAKMGYIKQIDKLEAEDPSVHKHEIAELRTAIKKSRSAPIIRKISQMNDAELIAENKKIRLRTKTKSEFHAMIRALRGEFEADNSRLIYET